MKRAALYVRVSSQGQVRDGYSLAFQEEILREFCKREEMVVAETYRDGGQSGSTTHRKDLLRLIEDARQSRFDVVLIFRVDRFSRDPVDLLALVRELENRRIKLRSVTEAVDASDPAGELMLTILGAIGKFVRQNIIQNAMLGKTKRAETGRYTGGKVPFGFVAGETGIYEPDQSPWWNGLSAAEVAQLVFTTYVRLARESGGCGSVAQELNRVGVPGPKTIWATAAIHQMLTNPCYVGDFTYNKRSHSLNKASQVHRPEEWTVVHGAHAPIVDRATWDQVQALLKQNKTYGGRQANEAGKDLIVGFLRCGECGSSLSGRRTTGKQNYTYYTCLSRFSERRTREGTACESFPYLRGPDLEKLIWTTLTETASSPSRIAELRARMKADVGPQLAEAEVAVRRLQKRTEQLQQQSMTLTTAFAEGKLPEYLWQQQLQRLESERRGLDDRLLQANAQVAELRAQSPISLSVEAIQAYLQGAVANRITLAEKREALTLLVGHRGIRVMRDGVIDFDLKFPPNLQEPIVETYVPSRQEPLLKTR